MKVHVHLLTLILRRTSHGTSWLPLLPVGSQRWSYIPGTVRHPVEHHCCLSHCYLSHCCLRQTRVSLGMCHNNDPTPPPRNISKHRARTINPTGTIINSHHPKGRAAGGGFGLSVFFSFLLRSSSERKVKWMYGPNVLPKRRRRAVYLFFTQSWYSKYYVILLGAIGYGQARAHASRLP